MGRGSPQDTSLSLGGSLDLMEDILSSGDMGARASDGATRPRLQHGLTVGILSARLPAKSQPPTEAERGASEAAAKLPHVTHVDIVTAGGQERVREVEIMLSNTGVKLLMPSLKEGRLREIIRGMVKSPEEKDAGGWNWLGNVWDKSSQSTAGTGRRSSSDWVTDLGMISSGPDVLLLEDLIEVSFEIGSKGQELADRQFEEGSCFGLKDMRLC